MINNNQPIRLPDGNSYRHEFVLTDNNGDALDLTDATFIILVKDKRTEETIYTWTTDDFLSVAGDPTEGIVGLRLLPGEVDSGHYTLTARYTLDDDVYEDDGPDMMVFS